MKKHDLGFKKTRPDTWLLQLRDGGQGPYLRSLKHLSHRTVDLTLGTFRTTMAQKSTFVTDGPMDRPTDQRMDGWTKVPIVA